MATIALFVVVFLSAVAHSDRTNSARGTWQYKVSAAAKWSSPKSSTFTVIPGSDGDYIVNGVDSTGKYFGHPAPGVLGF